MKIRHGFVTNSSSSSFIIAIKGGLENLDNLVDVQNESWKKFIVNGIKNLMDYCDSNETDEASLIMKSKEEVDAYFSDEYYSDNIAQKKQKYLDLVAKGYVVYEKRVSYHDGGLRNQLGSMQSDVIDVENWD